MSSFDGHEFGWDFVDHLAHTDPRTGRPYRGGTDLKHKRGENVKAYVTGKVSAVSRTSVTITPPRGNRTQILELGTVLVSVGDQVHPETVIGRAGLKWPHYNDLLPAGVHVRAAFLTPEPKRARFDMPYRYQLASNPKQLALAGQVGSACPGNWDQYIRDDARDGGRAPYEFAMYGEARVVDQVEWNRLKALFTTPAPAGVLTVDDATIAKLAQANAVAFFTEQKKAGN